MPTLDPHALTWYPLFTLCRFYFRQKGPVCANPEDKDVKRILLPRNKPVGSPKKCTPGR